MSSLSIASTSHELQTVVSASSPLSISTTSIYPHSIHSVIDSSTMNIIGSTTNSSQLHFTTTSILLDNTGSISSMNGMSTDLSSQSLIRPPSANSSTDDQNVLLISSIAGVVSVLIVMLAVATLVVIVVCVIIFRRRFKQNGNKTLDNQFYG